MPLLFLYGGGSQARPAVCLRPREAKREHWVPLCELAGRILDAARTLAIGNLLVFPSGRGKRLNDMALSGLLKDLEIAAVPDGFRSWFRDWVVEETNHPREVVEAAYARSDMFEPRWHLMDEWAAHLT